MSEFYKEPKSLIKRFEGWVESKSKTLGGCVILAILFTQMFFIALVAFILFCVMFANFGFTEMFTLVSDPQFWFCLRVSDLFVTAVALGITSLTWLDS